MPVVLLCHFDGTNGSTTFTDVSPSAHTLTAVGGAVVKTAQVKFGSGAADFTSGSGSRISVGGTQTDFQFASAPFTIEAWVYNGIGSFLTSGVFTTFLNNGGGDGFYFGFFSGDLVCWYNDGSNTQQRFQSSGSLVGSNAWHHIAVDRNAGGTLRLYVDGVVAASRSAPTFWNSTLTPQIGAAEYGGGSFVLNGYIDELRVVKGTAMYDGAFTPPTGPFGAAATAQARAWVMA